MSRERAEVLVIGGGLAGISAACELLDRGYGVTLVEKRPFLGGRTYSVVDQHTEIEVDNGQHVFMRCCTAYIDLLKRLNVFDRTHLQKRLRVLVGNGWEMATLGDSNLPAPFQMLPSLLGYPYLSMTGKARVLYGLAKIKRLSNKVLQALDDVSFYDWLRANHQPEAAIRNFWNLIVLPTLNDDVRLVSAAQAIMVFKVGFLGKRGDANIGFSTVGLSSLLSQAAQAYIEARGGRLLLGQKVERLLPDGDGIGGAILGGGDSLTADFYISALPHQDAHGLLPLALQDEPFFGRIKGLGSSPIVNVHLWYDIPVADFDFAAFLDNDVQWIFNKGAIFGEKGSGYLDVSLSGAREQIDLPAGEIAERTAEAVANVLPKARKARLVRHLVTKQHNATFAAAPGSGRLRPPARTPLANFFLAGDWTDTGWPATMESAVHSGINCAEAIVTATNGSSNGTKEAQAVNFVT